MKPQNFRMIAEKIRSEFRTILKNCYTEFVEVNVEEATGQIFTLEAFFGEEYIGANQRSFEHNDIIRPIIYFQAKGNWGNRELNINDFFSINDQIFDEFDELCDRGELDSLGPLLMEGLRNVEAKDLGQAEVDTYFFLTIESSICNGNNFLKGLLKESITTLELNEISNKVNVGCIQMERKKITALLDNTPVSLEIPFDKVDYFKPFQKEVEPVVMDDKYIFVAMSFQNNPLLEDTYSTIKRSVKSLKKGFRCERVDEIHDDFVINDKIIDCIKKARLLIVDLTGNRPNVYYELGYARALGKQIVLVSREGEIPHFDVQNQNIIFFNNTTSLEKSLNTRLRSILKTNR
ncbi:hypothetical protein [Paenibacillus sp. IHBB 10380]|uniref:hypothetical protein n=1 Tax=Paenibacillus sp. IHBB 10380 TaxID=1566358 RepID=UPI0005CFE5F1|nr:hypothetical protein [Paenibacillus sp. IHBB 10380]AJS59008.1 hypothetical protein UB51_11610 [Paenibacillus sp. IHBB 10380]